jgi:ABC-type branched-subunit amino acid transport system ATPase component
VLVEECRANNTTVLMVEQNLDLVLGIANRWAVLKLGRIDDAGEMDSGSRARILAHLKI